MKFCSRCQKYKEDEDFSQHNKKTKQAWCRLCNAEYSRRWYEANKSSHIEYVSSHRKRKVHKCKHCGRSEPDVKFYIKRQSDRFYRRFICYECDREYNKRYPKKADALKRETVRRKANLRISRQDKSSRFRWIVRDSRLADKKARRQNDLDFDFVKYLIASGCSYCGDVDAKMTLDRKDNAIGHTKINVVAACMRCNMFRRDMPYQAWLLVAPIMKKARNLGLLDGWHSSIPSSIPSLISIEEAKKNVGEI